jgi:hypothetical protein
MIERQIDNANQENRNKAGIGRPAVSRSKTVPAAAPGQRDWQSDPGIVNTNRA